MFVIVKNASKECKNRWMGNPREGVHQSFSCHNTPTGQSLGIRPSYSVKEVVEEFKRVAQIRGVGYKTLMRVSLKALASTGNFTF